MSKWVYTFGDGAAEGRAGDKNLLGGKGANLAEMCSLGLPVPPGFTITTEMCNWYYANGRRYPDEFEAQLDAALDHIGKVTGRREDLDFSDLHDNYGVGFRLHAPQSTPLRIDVAHGREGFNIVFSGAAPF